jgi:hypothetical protein
MMVKAKDIQPGDIVTKVPYGEPSDKLPLTVIWNHPAKAKYCRILEGTNSAGARTLIPVGHQDNVCEVQR